MFFISNLVCGLDKGLNDPHFLLDTVRGTKMGIEFFVHTYSEAYMEKLADISAWLGKIPVAVHGPFINVEATSIRGTDAYRVLIDAYGKAFEFARQHGCAHVVFHTNERVVTAENKAALQKNCRENLETLAADADRYGVRLLVENLGIPAKGLPLFDQDEFIALFAEYPQLDCIIDIGHLFLARWDLQTVLAALRDKIRAYHLHNNDGKFDTHRRITDGNFDYGRFFDAYKTHTPHADMTLEYGDAYGISPAQLLEDAKMVLRETNRRQDF